MVLVFGGTTEGKKVAELFDVIGQDYFYSTKTDAHKEIKGKRIFGALNKPDMLTFCKYKNIRLIVDAAHPFATELHETIFNIASEMQIEVIRYERNYPFYDSPLLRYFGSYDAMLAALSSSAFSNVFALTGVQTITRFKSFWQEREIYFRILNTDLSKEKARKTGISSKYVVPMTPKADKAGLVELSKKLNAEILISKESGESGFFEAKVKASQELNIPLWVVKRPSLPYNKNIVDNPRAFLQLFYSLRKTALKEEGILKSGYTTGTCVTACAKACFLALTHKRFPQSVQVELPDGEKVRMPVFPETLTENTASCIVVKDAGDDPDVTHGKEIGCELELSETPRIDFIKGKGIGLVTLPGLQVKVGEPAINPVPRKMISDMLFAMSDEYETEYGFSVKPFVPEGEELAKQTFNPRVGVMGGISIIGTSGRVKPYSNEAFLESIRQQVRVAKENECTEVVLTSGKRSENKLREEFPNLPHVAFIHFGNMIGEAIKLAASERIKKINLAIMLGKAVKLAEGHMDTHSKKVVFNPGFVANLAKEAGYPEDVVNQIKNQKLANAITDIIPFPAEEPFYKSIAKRCYKNCLELLPQHCNFALFLQVGDLGVIRINK